MGIMEIIYSYSRKQAIEDGVLFDITETPEAQEAGFKIPICLTAGVSDLVKVPEKLEGLQDFTGRLWDVCFMAANAFRRAEDKALVPFQVSFLMAPGKSKLVKLWLVFNEHEGFTVMLPEEY